VSSYSSYAQFLEKFAEKVLRAAGPWERVKDWVTRFGRQVKPDVSINMATGEISLSLGKGVSFDPDRARRIRTARRVDQECGNSHGDMP
jgi:hypothetical protein